MADKDWDRELAKIDKQLESVSDEQLFPKSAAKTTPQREAIVEKQSRGLRDVPVRLTQLRQEKRPLGGVLELLEGAAFHE